MNHETATHLDRLYDQARPLSLIEPRTGHYDKILIGQFPKSLVERLNNALAAAWPATIEAEIILAAKESRKTSWTNESPCLILENGTLCLYDGAIADNYLRAYPHLCSIVAAHNAETADRYERYRQLCMQGVALPPAAE